MFNWLVFLIAYLPFQIALNPGFGFDLSCLRIFILILFFFWFFCKRPFFPMNLQTICLILFLLISSFSVLIAENHSWALRKLLFFASIFPLYFLVSNLTDNWLKIRKIVSVLVMAGGLIALIGLLQFLTQFVFGLEKVYDFWAWNIVPIFSGFNFGALILAYPSWLVNLNGQTIMRSFSIFSDPHMFSFYLGLIIPLGIAFSLKKPKRKLWIVISCLLFCALLMSFTRGAYLAIIITFLILAGLVWKYLKAKKTALILCLSLLIFIIPITPIAHRFYSSFDLEEGSNLGRLEMWQNAGMLGQKHFWQGIGLGNYSLFVNQELEYRNPATAHNLYLDLFSELGIFALIIWLVLILGTIWQLGTDPGKGQCLIKIGLIGSLSYFFIHSFFETSIYNPVVLALLMVVLGLSAALNSHKG